MRYSDNQGDTHDTHGHFAATLAERIIILDGAMGTMIQQYPLEEADFRGERFKDHPSELKGFNDLLCLTRPDIIREIHQAYADAGADILETNTFNGTSIAAADYQMEDVVFEINKQAAAIARQVAEDRSQRWSGALGGRCHRPHQSDGIHLSRC